MVYLPLWVFEKKITLHFFVGILLFFSHKKIVYARLRSLLITLFTSLSLTSLFFLFFQLQTKKIFILAS